MSLPDAPSRLNRLDGLRAIAACGVAFTYHTQALYADGALDFGDPLSRWLHSHGWLFVDMFFVLSGYIFAHVYLGRSQLKDGRSLADFAVARVARLYPLHLVMLLVTAALFWSKPENTALAFGAHLLMLQAFVPPISKTFDGPTWSLSIEVVCYVLFAFGAAAGKRTLRLVTWFCIALGMVMLLVRAASTGPYMADIFPRGIFGFFVGQVLWQHRDILARLPAIALAAIAVAGVLMPTDWIGIVLPLSGITFPAVLVLGLRLRWLESRPLAWLGDRSYAIYLIQGPVIDTWLKYREPVGGSLAEVLLGHAAFIVAVLLLSDLAYRQIEKPARKAVRHVWDNSGLRLRKAEQA